MHALSARRPLLPSRAASVACLMWCFTTLGGQLMPAVAASPTTVPNIPDGNVNTDSATLGTYRDDDYDHFSNFTSHAVSARYSGRCNLGVSGEGQDYLTDIGSKPTLYLWDGTALTNARQAFQAGKASSGLVRAVAAATERSERHISKGCPVYTVVRQKMQSPSGDPRDYVSTAFYGHPCNSSPCGAGDSCDFKTGMPWQNCDGHHDEKLRKGTAPIIWYALHDRVADLTFAYWYGGSTKYAYAAAQLLRDWFITPDTRMNPHLKYGQSLPGVYEGAFTGIIQFNMMPEILDMAAMLRMSGAWTAGDHSQLMKWCRAFLDWLRTSDLGREARRADNNHGIWYTQTTLALALHTGNRGAASEAASDLTRVHIPGQIASNGILTNEVTRPWSRHYTAFTLQAFFRAARLAKNLGVTVFSDSRVKNAATWPLSYLLGESKWPYPCTDPDYDERLFGEFLRIAESAYSDVKFEQAFQRIKADGDVVMPDHTPSVSPALVYPRN